MENIHFVAWFSVLCLACALCAVMAVFLAVGPANAAADPVSLPPAPPIVHITDDPGGNVGEYYRKYAALNAAGAEIHFHGVCASACTIVFFKEFTSIKACADDGAIFGFHKPFEESGGKVIHTKSAVRASRKLWQAWLEELPDRLHDYLQHVRVPSAAEGDERNTMLVLPASLLLPKCPVNVAAQ